MRLFCALAVLLLAPAALAQTPDTALATRAGRLADAFFAGRDSAVVAALGPAMRARMTPAALIDVRRQVAASVGAFERRGAPRAEAGAPGDTLRRVRVPLTFARGALDLRLVYGRDDRVAGLFFVPAATAEAAGGPPYADTSAFRERRVTVEREGFGALAATLALPRGAAAGRPVPAVVLVHGSGPSDADETVGGTKVFRDVAWGLASRGVAVLRYEKRTRAHPDEFVGRVYTVDDEVTEDALAALAVLRATPGVDAARVYVVGHSLGGMMAPRIAARDGRLAGVALLAAPARPLTTLLAEQVRYLAVLDTSAAVRQSRDAVLAVLDRLAALPADADASALVLGAPVRYWRSVAAVDPVAEARALAVPLLVVQGGRDYQVTMTDFDAWRAALGGRAGARFEAFPALNHLLVAGEGPSAPAEYARPAFVDARVVAALAEWLRAR